MKSVERALSSKPTYYVALCTDQEGHLWTFTPIGTNGQVEAYKVGPGFSPLELTIVRLRELRRTLLGLPDTFWTTPVLDKTHAKGSRPREVYLHKGSLIFYTVTFKCTKWEPDFFDTNL